MFVSVVCFTEHTKNVDVRGEGSASLGDFRDAIGLPACS